MANQRRYVTRLNLIVGFAFVCVLFGTRVTAANPEFVAVQVTFVDPVEIRAAEAGTPADGPASLLVTDTAHQASSVLVESADGSFDVTFSYQ